jgi:hypothetical protein
MSSVVGKYKNGFLNKKRRSTNGEINTTVPEKTAPGRNINKISKKQNRI